MSGVTAATSGDNDGMGRTTQGKVPGHSFRNLPGRPHDLVGGRRGNAEGGREKGEGVREDEGMEKGEGGRGKVEG